MKMYIAVLDEFPDYMVPTLVAHAVLGAHDHFTRCHTDLERIVDDGPYKFPEYIDWFKNSYRKSVVRVNQREFDKIAALPDCYLAYESTVLEGRNACAIPLPCSKEDRPNVLKFAQHWKPKT
jgi:hypothetical protein